MALKAFKFVIPGDRFIDMPGDSPLAYKGCLAVAIAEDEKSARELIEKYGRENNKDTRWLVIAKCVPFTLDAPAVIGWAMV